MAENYRVRGIQKSESVEKIKSPEKFRINLKCIEQTGFAGKVKFEKIVELIPAIAKDLKLTRLRGQFPEVEIYKIKKFFEVTFGMKYIAENMKEKEEAVNIVDLKIDLKLLQIRMNYAKAKNLMGDNLFDLFTSCFIAILKENDDKKIIDSFIYFGKFMEALFQEFYYLSKCEITQNVK